MRVSHALSYTALIFLAACASVTQTQPTLTPSPAPTATTDWSTQMQLTFSGTGDYATPPFEALEAITSDGEPVTIDITLIFYISPVLIRNVDLDKWDDYLKNRVIPDIREAVAEVISQYA